MIEVLKGLGLEDVRVAHRFDCFRSTSKESVARKFGVYGINIFARKPNLAA